MSVKENPDRKKKNKKTGINKSDSLVKHISCDCRCRFGGKNKIQRKIGIMISVAVYIKKPFKEPACKNSYVWNSSICACKCDKIFEIDKYLNFCICIKHFAHSLVTSNYT